MRRTLMPAALAPLLVMSSVIAQPASAAETVTLVNVIDTSQWSPPSPDPIGLAWLPAANSLLVVDSEVEEMPNLYAGVNVWKTTSGGQVTGTSTTTGFSVEPVGAAWNHDDGHVIISDDNQRRVFQIDVGPDGLVGTSDDVRTNFRTAPFGSGDPEGLAYGDRAIFIADGVGKEIFRVDRGPNGIFDGVASVGGDDVVSSFDTEVLGMTDPEGLEFDPASNHLFIASRREKAIAEVTLSGALVRTIDVRFSGIKRPAGVALAPGSDVPAEMHLFVSDRAVDNDSDPNENDGRIFEFRLGDSSPPQNSPPSVTNPGNQSNVEGDVVSLQILASDPDGDGLTYDAQDLPPGLSIDAGTGLISGSIQGGTAGTYNSSVTGSDGSLTDTESFTWTVAAPDQAPAVPVELVIAPETIGLSLDWANNTESDLTGYNVYRSTGGTFQKLNGQPLAVSEYLDGSAPIDATSNYRVTAVDAGGNESQPAEASAHRGPIAFVGATTAQVKSSTSLVVTRPGSVAAGDVMVAVIDVRSGASITAPAGWSFVRRDASGTALQQAIYVKPGGTTEPSSYQWTFSAKSAATGAIAAYRGVDLTSPLVSASGGQVSGNQSSIPAPSVSASTPGSVLVGAFGIATNATIAPPTGMVEQAEALLTQGNLKGATEVSDDILVASGATGVRTAIASKSAVNIGQVIVLRPQT